MSKFCYHPWVGLDISPQGEFKPCCKFSTVVAHSLSEYQSSDIMDRVRKQFTKGEQPDECKRCWRDEAAGIVSKRELDFKYVLEGTSPSLESIKVLMLPFGNTCNLACRICSSHSSSFWRGQAKKLTPIFPETSVLQHKKFYKDQDFMSDIINITKDVVHVGFPGGEPFITGVKEHLDFLDTLIGRSPKNISLHYITNTTVFPDERFWERWGKFKKVDIQLSIDGIGKHFEYNRWPAKWPECLPNILSYRDRITDNMQLSISHSVSIFTVYYLPEFIKWCFDSGLPQPYLGLVTTPEYYDIAVLPSQTKDIIEARLSGSLMEPIAAAMQAQDQSIELDKTIQYIKILDKHRNQSFADTFPELYQLIGETWAI